MAHITLASGHFKPQMLWFHYTTPRRHATRLNLIDLTSTLKRGNLKSTWVFLISPSRAMCRELRIARLMVPLVVQTLLTVFRRQLNLALPRKTLPTASRIDWFKINFNFSLQPASVSSKRTLTFRFYD